jgi:hypothetical protein
MRSSALRSDWRWPAAALLAEIAAIHIALVPEHLRQAPYAAGLFIALSAACLALAVRIVIRDDRPAWTAACGLAASAIFAYLISRSVGLPMMGDDIGDWLNPLGIGAMCAETITLAISMIALLHRGVVAQPVCAPRRRPLATGSA